MVKELLLGLMEESMSENTKMGNIMVKESSLGLMEASMLGHSMMGIRGKDKCMTKKETSLGSG